jgi:uncharacterized membrane protein required for colicin V production
MSLGDLGLSWFDLMVLVVLGIGVWRGRSRGMSEELLDVLKWLVIVVVGALVYRPVGKYISDYTHFSAGACYVAVYVSVLVLMRLFFGWIKRGVGEKLVGSDVFGNSEFYLGMLAGAVRFGCYVIVALALLNARYVSPEEMVANARMQKENFEDISFPTIGTIQQNVFKGSASGQLVKRYLGHELIVPNKSDGSAGGGNTIARQQEREINEILGNKK